MPFCVWPFKCKWAAAEGGVSRARELAAGITSRRQAKMAETVLRLSQSKMKRLRSDNM